jgi:hypothetical protein
MYIHASIAHIMFNMIALLFFGLLFEEKIGALKFGIIYFSCGVIAIFAYAVSNFFTPSILVGASGAICGIIGAFARLYPMERMMFIMGFIPLPPMPVIVWAAIFLILQVFLAVFSASEFGMVGSNIAYTAHIGGLIFGFIIAPLVAKIALGRKEMKIVELKLAEIAHTPFLKDLVDKIKCEDIAEIKLVWLQEFASKSRCPVCKHKLFLKGLKLVCHKCSYKIKLDK